MIQSSQLDHLTILTNLQLRNFHFLLNDLTTIQIGGQVHYAVNFLDRENAFATTKGFVIY